MRVAIHQPNYLPYLGFFHKIYLSDTFVILDSAQFVKSGPLAWMNRNKIRTPQGWAWVSVPVLTKGKFPVTMNEALIDNKINWRKKHYYSLYYNYCKAPHFTECDQYLKALYEREWDSLCAFNREIIGYLLTQLDISVKTVTASELNVGGAGTDLLVNICKELGANEYIYGAHGQDYMDLGKFQQAGIKPVAQGFKHPRYKQLHEPFIENMSVVDLLFNEGAGSAAGLLAKMKADNG